MLYRCKNNIDSYEIGRMVPYFWKKFYFNFIVKSAILNFLISIIIFVCFQHVIDAVLFFTVFFIFNLIYYKVNLSNVVTKSVRAHLIKKKINIEVEIEFYSTYLIQKKNDMSLKINYYRFNKSIETDTNFYLQYLENRKEKIIIIQKNSCTLELIQFIRKKVDNLENHLCEKKGIIHNQKKSKTIKKIIWCLTGLSILSILGGLYTVAMYNEVNDIHNASFIQSTWLFWLWLPLSIISTVISYIYQKRGIDCSKNMIISFVASICLLIFGFFSILPTSFDDQVNHYSIIENYESIMDVRVPSSGQLKLGTLESFDYKNISDLEIITVNYEHEDTTALAKDIMNNDNWILSTEVSSELKKLVPAVFSSNDDMYYLFYNSTLSEYNTVPDIVGDYQIYTMKYDISKKNLIIYTFNYHL